jgi:AmmeMemoRadiSam system protein B
MGPVTTSDLAWRTELGAMEPDVEAVDRLVKPGLARRDPAIVEHEHGLAGLVPAIAYFMPTARIVPLAARKDLNTAAVEALADQLARLAALEGTVIVLSADLSHGLEAAEARRMDRETLGALERLDAGRLRRVGPEHLDARGAAAALLLAMRRLGATEFVLRANSDASMMPGYAGGPVTSYAVGYLRRGSTALDGVSRVAAPPAHP